VGGSQRDGTRNGGRTIPIEVAVGHRNRGGRFFVVTKRIKENIKGHMLKKKIRESRKARK